MAYDWTPERVRQLRRLWMRHSIGEIAAMMGTTKGSIAGKRAGLRLPSKDSRVLSEDSAAFFEALVERTCRRAVTDGDEPRLCGDVAEMGHSFCFRHCDTEYVHRVAGLAA